MRAIAKAASAARLRAGPGIAAVLCALAFAAGCNGGGSGASCVSGISTTCTPLYDPTYQDLFAKTLKPTCGLAGSACHAPEGAMYGFVVDTPDATYTRLLATSQSGLARVQPGDPGCSEVIRRLTSTDPTVEMPPGAPLSDAERCAFIQWIANGAKQ